MIKNSSLEKGQAGSLSAHLFQSLRCLKLFVHKPLKVFLGCSLVALLIAHQPLRLLPKFVLGHCFAICRQLAFQNLDPGKFA